MRRCRPTGRWDNTSPIPVSTKNHARDNLALARRLQVVAEHLVADLDAQYRKDFARPKLDFKAAGLSDNDHLAINGKGIRVSRFRDTTILQLIARDAHQKIMTMVEAHAAGAVIDPSPRATIRQIRTGVLMWNESNNTRQNQHAYTAVRVRGSERLVLLHDSSSAAASWTLTSSRDSAANRRYDSFDEAIVDIGSGLDAQVAAWREGRLQAFQGTLAPADIEWSVDAARKFARERPDVPGLEMG